MGFAVILYYSRCYVCYNLCGSSQFVLKWEVYHGSRLTQTQLAKCSIYSLTRVHLIIRDLHFKHLYVYSTSYQIINSKPMFTWCSLSDLVTSQEVLDLGRVVQRYKTWRDWIWIGVQPNLNWYIEEPGNRNQKVDHMVLGGHQFSIAVV